jgi:hypothetical protein
LVMRAARQARSNAWRAKSVDTGCAGLSPNPWLPFQPFQHRAGVARFVGAVGA